MSKLIAFSITSVRFCNTLERTQADHSFVLKCEKSINTKLLVNTSKIEKGQDKFYKSRKGLEHRYIPSRNSIKQFAVYIIGDVVSILSMEKNNLVGIKITNQYFADNFRSIFKTLWDGAGR